MIRSLRLGYKKIGDDSYDFLREYFAREDTTRYLPRGRPYSDQEVQQFIRSSIDHWHSYGFGLFLLYLKSHNSCIGYCGLEYAMDTAIVDLRYGVIVKHWGKGYATEAAQACLNYGFYTLEFPVIYGAVVPDNISSLAIMNKIGMSQTDEVDFYGTSVRYFKIERDGLHA